MFVQQKLALKWKSFLSLTTLSGTLVFGLSAAAIASPIPLTTATLRKVVNQVELLLQSQTTPRSARVNDRLTKGGDQIKTRQSSRAELKFNDGTLAKVGELATFRFTPDTRRFDLGNGTYLFLVPPGRGSTEFYTPNAKAGVRGSALFIRYIQETDTTIMGALTNNPLGPMDITAGGQKQDLYAGQMAVVVKNRIDRVESFDINTFLSTSPLYREIDLTESDLQAVGQEVSDAAGTQLASIPAIVPSKAIVSETAISLPNAVNVSDLSRIISHDAAIARKSFNGKPSAVPGNSEPTVSPDPIVRPNAPSIQPSPASESLVVEAAPQPIRQEPVAETPVVRATPQPIRQEPVAETPVVRPTPVPITDPNGHGHGRTHVRVLVDGRLVEYLVINGKIDYSGVIYVNPLPVPVQPAPAVEVVKPAPAVEPIRKPVVEIASPAPAVERTPAPVAEIARPAPVAEIARPAPVTSINPVAAPAIVPLVTPSIGPTTPSVFSPISVPVSPASRTPVIPSAPIVVPIEPVVAPIAAPPVVVTVPDPIVRSAPAITAPIAAPPVVVTVPDPIVRPNAPAIIETISPVVPSAPVAPAIPIVTAPAAPVAPIVTVPIVLTAPVAPVVIAPIVPTVPVIPSVPEPAPISVAPATPIVPASPAVTVVPAAPVVVAPPVAPPVVAPVAPATIVTP